MLRNQLPLAVLATALALLLGDADAEADHSRHQNRRSYYGPDHDRVHVGHGSGSYGNRNHAWNNARRNPYGHGTHGRSYYGRNGHGYSI